MLLFIPLKQITNVWSSLFSSFGFLNCPEIRNFWISKELSFSSLRNTMTLLKVLKKKKKNPKTGRFGRGKMAAWIKDGCKFFPTVPAE